MTTLLLRHVVLDGRSTCVLIRDNRFESLDVPGDSPADDVIDGHGTLAIVPAFYNAHTHAAMTVLRGFAEDLQLETWLQDYIWPVEAALTEQDIYAGSRLAILEMIRSGTVFFNDMYWHPRVTARAVEDMGTRAAIGLLYITGPDGELLPRCREEHEQLLGERHGDRVLITHAPHSTYAVSRRLWEEIAADVASSGRMLHTHAAETRRDVRDCLESTGRTPVGYLDQLGVLGDHTVLAHCIHTTPSDLDRVAATGSVIAHMPVSNLKLCSGFFDLPEAARAGCRLALGTDGAASNNNLSMLEEMKFAALLAKSQANSPLAGRDDAIWDMATVGGADAFGIEAGRIEAGLLADALLLDLDHPTMVGDYSLAANLVYSADTSVIHTVICDGRVLMRDRVVPGEAEIVAEAREVCRRLASRR